MAQSWYRSFFKPNPKLGPVVTARAGNVIGGGDYALDRIVPDCIRSLIKKQPILVRNPAAVRPWQHVLECLSGYLWLGARIAKEPKDLEAREPRLISARNLPRASRCASWWRKCFPSGPANGWTAPTRRASHEATLLTLSIEKAGALLKWTSGVGFHRKPCAARWSGITSAMIGKKVDMVEFSVEQIDAYVAAARRKQTLWTA